MNPTFTRLELRRVFRDRVGMFFTAGLPAFLYLIFGASQPYAEEDAGDGNVAAFIMISMAAYGAVTATTAVGGTAAVERMQGWGRQLGLTPLRDHSLVVMKTIVALVVAAVPIALIYVLGGLSGATADIRVWVLSGVTVLLGSAVFGLYGVAMGLAFRTEAAVSAASGLVVVMAFLGNIFVTLSGTLLTIAKFTPLYGYAALARYPLTDGYHMDGSHDPLWVPIANVSVWAAIFAVAATMLVRRGRERQ